MGGNLFHSFGLFNIHNGESATFTGPSSVNYIIGRVTGGSSSTIDGLLRSEIPGANLFLINPAGVMFGPNAQLDVGGSFHVSTADYLRLGKEGRFDARFPNNSILTVASPTAFGFLGPNPAAISFHGSSYKVSAGKTLSVIGGNLEITEESSLQAPGGRINMASVASPGEVDLTDPNLGIASFSRLGQITIDKNSTVDTSGDGAGTVFVRSGRLVMDNSVIGAVTTGDTNGNAVGIDIALTEDFSLSNQAVIQTGANGSGNAGDMRIAAKNITLTSGANLHNLGTGAGRSGNITVTADSISFSGSAPGNGTQELIRSGISQEITGSGNGGSISIKAGELNIRDDAKISSQTSGKGDAGNITVETGRLTIANSKISSETTQGTGNGGDITVTATDQISISDQITEQDSTRVRSGISSDTIGDGHAGSLFVVSPRLEIRGNGIITASSVGKGNAGNITLRVGSLDLMDGADIDSSLFDTDSTANGPDVTINASDRISISGESRISSTNLGHGRGGTLSISSHILEVQDGCDIRTNSVGPGVSGDIKVDVAKLILTGQAAISTGTVGGVAGDIVFPIIIYIFGINPFLSCLSNRLGNPIDDQLSVTEGHHERDLVVRFSPNTG